MKKMLVALGTLIALTISIPASFASCHCSKAAPCPSCATPAPCSRCSTVSPSSYYVLQPTGFACPCTAPSSCDSCCDNKCPEKCRWWKFWQNKNCCEKCNKCDTCCD